MTTLLSWTKLALFTGMLLATSTIYGAIGGLDVVVPKTAYIQWVTNPNDVMNSVNGSGTASMDPYAGGPLTQLQNPSAKDTYLAIMCNSLAGYDITLTATNGGATGNTGKMSVSGGADLTYTVSLAVIPSTVTGGTTITNNIDLTGTSPSGTAVFTAPGDLPLQANAPNVWKLTTSLPTINSVSDGLIMSGTYQGGITATITLK